MGLEKLVEGGLQTVRRKSVRSSLQTTRISAKHHYAICWTRSPCLSPTTSLLDRSKFTTFACNTSGKICLKLRINLTTFVFCSILYSNLNCHSMPMIWFCSLRYYMTSKSEKPRQIFKLKQSLNVYNPLGSDLGTVF